MLRLAASFFAFAAVAVAADLPATSPNSPASAVSPLRSSPTVSSSLSAAPTVTAAQPIGGPVMNRATLMAAATESAVDNISSGWCGRGMLSVLQSVGFGKGLQGGNGQDWETILSKAGWRPVRCMTPFQAPLGSVLVYLGDARVGKRIRGTPGGYFGHVEMVALDRNGQRLYVSDCPRTHPGGSVYDNFTGRAWLPPGRSIAVKTVVVSVEAQVQEVLQERKRMAMAYFNRPARQEFTSLQTLPVANTP